MKLEVGMYVRTENGIIEKINKIYDRHVTDNIVVWLNGYGDGRSVFIDDFEEVKYQSINARGFIKKEPSFNPIDLIEKGDYINGKKVIDKWEEPSGAFAGETFIKLAGEDTVPTMRKIESIVTKEQFESMSYKVGD